MNNKTELLFLALIAGLALAYLLILANGQAVYSYLTK